jgi:hypothetical protein
MFDNVLEYLYCRWQGHDWKYTDNEEGITTERKCIQCDREEKAEIKWKKKKSD